VSERATGLPNGTEQEDATVRLLRAAGPRAAMPTPRADRVRSTVRAAWQMRTRRRAIRRRVVLAAALVGAAALVLVAARVAVPDRSAAPFGEPVGVVEQIDGIAAGVQRADVVRVGQWIETGPESRIALRFGREGSVRLDRGSRMRAVSSNVIELSSGALYLDTGQDHGHFEIRTAVGTARDIGTQFEVRLVEDSLRLRVRTGLVELSNRARSMTGRPGTEIMFSPGGAVTRPIAAHGSEWAWVSRVAPPLEMEGLPLATLLERVAREHGWTVEYHDSAIAREAETIVLHGSVNGLAPHEAVEVAIATSGLQHRLSGGLLVVSRANAREADERGIER
jgi:ferric-dicitrate binding protein FerR (iron transport regulator)